MRDVNERIFKEKTEAKNWYSQPKFGKAFLGSAVFVFIEWLILLDSAGVLSHIKSPLSPNRHFSDILREFIVCRICRDTRAFSGIPMFKVFEHFENDPNA